MEKPSYAIDRFDPLLRDLLNWGLAVTDDKSQGQSRWLLTDRAQKRLSELVRAQPRPATDRVVYLDHRCADCRQRLPTRLSEDVYLCDGCRTHRAELAPAEAALADPDRADPASFISDQRSRHRRPASQWR